MVGRPRVLRGGKAPRHWKRELSRLTEAWESMPQRCDWIAEIAETHPRLLSEPLLGTCLTTVTSNQIARSDSNNEAPAGRLTSAHPASNRGKETAFDLTASSKRRQIRSPVFSNEESEKARHSDVASQLPRRASDSLLRRAAPDALDVTENLLSATSLLRSRPDSPPVTSPMKITRLEWLRLVANRAAKKWISDWTSASTHKFSSSAVVGDRSRRSRSSTTTQTNESKALATELPARVETSFLPDLHDDWLLPIPGQQASPQILASLVKRSKSLAEHSTEKIRRNETFTRSNSESRSLPSSPDPLVAEQRSFPHGPDISRPLDRMFERQSPTLPADDRSLALPLDSTINSEVFREQLAPPGLAPTVLTPALSPLLPPASAGSQVLPIAADTARRIAWRDEVDAQQTDLSVLAAQVKRILDEEARRHGIDV